MHDHPDDDCDCQITHLAEKILDALEAHDICGCAVEEVIEALDEANLFYAVPLDDLKPGERP
jgi:hypothetical protein